LKDSLIAAFSLGTFFVFGFLSLTSPINLTFYPYPTVSPPYFQWPIAFSILLFSSPLWFRYDD
jgi:hypothetical protein